MTRRLLILSPFLLAGAVVNVGVAWGCAEWSRFDTVKTNPLAEWPQPVPDNWPPPKGRRDLIGFGAAVDWTYAAIAEEELEFYHLRITSAGWPMLSLHGAIHNTDGPTQTLVTVGIWQIDSHQLPLHPFWLGYVSPVEYEARNRGTSAA